MRDVFLFDALDKQQTCRLQWQTAGKTLMGSKWENWLTWVDKNICSSLLNIFGFPFKTQDFVSHRSALGICNEITRYNISRARLNWNKFQAEIPSAKYSLRYPS